MNETAKAAWRVLIVEDEAMIRMLLEDMLEDLGFQTAGAAGRLEDAVRLAGTTEFDVAILDMNLNGESVEPVIDVLKKRGLPYIFASGYGGRELPEDYKGRPILQKPFQQESLGLALNQALAR